MKKNLLNSVKTVLFGGVAFLAVGLLPTSCTNSGKEQKTGFTISGVVVGGATGDSVFLEIIKDGELQVVDKTALADSTFFFTGRQDSLAVYYLSCVTSSAAFSTPIFVENAEISVRLEDVNEVITGTQANDAYQEVRGKINDVRRRMLALDADTSLTDEDREAKETALDDEYAAVLLEGQNKNITNLVGIFMFKQRFGENTLGQNQKLFKQIPEQYLSDPELQGIKKMLENQESTNVDSPFTDLTLQTPEGKEVKLSDFVGKGKPVLVDFWASWCGPCRSSMPELVELYAKYKGKFEIVGISLDENKDAWTKAIKDLRITWPQMSDLKGWGSVASTTYGVNAIPHTMLINKDGIIVARELHGDRLEESLVKLF